MTLYVRNKLVCGVGVNDADYKVHDRQRLPATCSFYNCWKSMLNRCYSDREQKRKPTYRGCKVSPEWLVFSNFKTWMETQDHQGKHLDKDFLGNGKVYSPQTCCFVPLWLNNLFTDSGAARGKYPIGVHFDKDRGKFTSQLSIGGKRTNLGRYNTLEEACQIYLTARTRYVTMKMEDYPDQRVKKAVLERINGSRI